MESLNKIDLSGLKDRKTQFLCLTIFFFLLSALMLYHQKNLFFNHLGEADTKAYGRVIRIIRKESGDYPVYRFQKSDHISLIANSQDKIHQRVTIYYNKKQPQTFYAKYEADHLAGVLMTRLVIIAVFIFLALLNFYLYKKTSYH